MQEDISERIETLKTTGVVPLLAQYKELFGNRAVPGNRIFLIRQIAHKIQELKSGGISMEISARIQKLIDTYDPINKTATKSRINDLGTQRDNRLPIPGSVISKLYKGQKIDVKVLENGFEYQSVIYKNLSAIAKAITGSHWNGFIFFGVKKSC